jgi:chromosome segregation ATPase
MDLLKEWLTILLGGAGIAGLIRYVGPPLIGYLATLFSPAVRVAVDDSKLRSEAAAWGYSRETIEAQNKEIAELRAEIRQVREEMRREIDALKAKHTQELEQERSKRRELEEEVVQLRNEVGRLRHENQQLQAQVNGEQ